MVGAQVDKLQVRVGHQVPGDDEHRAADGDKGFFGAAPAGQSSVAGAERGVGAAGPAPALPGVVIPKGRPGRAAEAVGLTPGLVASDVDAHACKLVTKSRRYPSSGETSLHVVMNRELR